MEVRNQQIALSPLCAEIDLHTCRQKNAQDLKIGVDIDSSNFGVDIDVSAFVIFKKDEQMENQLAFYNCKELFEGGVEVVFDWTGGNSHDHIVYVRADKIPDSMERIVLVATIYNPVPKKHNAIRYFDKSAVFSLEIFDEPTNELLTAATYTNVAHRKNNLVLADLRRTVDGWLFVPIGIAKSTWLEGLCRKFKLLVNK